MYCGVPLKEGNKEGNVVPGCRVPGMKGRWSPELGRVPDTSQRVWPQSVIAACNSRHHVSSNFHFSSSRQNETSPFPTRAAAGTRRFPPCVEPGLTWIVEIDAFGCVLYPASRDRNQRLRPPTCSSNKISISSAGG